MRTAKINEQYYEIQEPKEAKPVHVLGKRDGIAIEKDVQSVVPIRLPGKQIEILVVESNPADTHLTEIAFKAAGLTSGFYSVSDGEDALAYVHKEGKYANVATPDLIFLDLSLPRVSGLEVLKAIKSTPHLMHIPCVCTVSFRHLTG